MCPILNDADSNNLSVHDKKQAARRAILEHSIEEDQAQVIDRWLKTIIYSGPANEPNDQAVTAILLFMACVAAGTFEISLKGESGKPGLWTQPSDVLSIADYLSHGSRVMIDLEGLSQENINTFLEYFPKGKNQENMRISTHSVIRDSSGELVEKKGIFEAFGKVSQTVVHNIGNYISWFANIFNERAKETCYEGKPITDFGVNVMMGGIDQLNLIGETSQLGSDGHLYMYLGEKLKAVMIGLEQAKPPSLPNLQSIYSKLSSLFTFETTNRSNNNSTEEPSSFEDFVNTLDSSHFTLEHSEAPIPFEDNPNTGLAGPHSIFGHSDAYTAAGSLYFSNLIYQAKLFDEKGIRVPSKYNGMRVKFRDDSHFQKVMALFQSLKENHQNPSIIEKFLKELPNNRATNDNCSIEENRQKSIGLFLDSITEQSLKECFQQLQAVYFENNTNALDNDAALFKTKLTEIKSLRYWLHSSENKKQEDLKIALFTESEITNNPHIKRLVSIFNYAIKRLEQEAIEKLRSWKADPDLEFKQIDVLSEAYKKFSIKNPFASNQSTIRKIIDYIYCIDSQESLVLSSACANSNNDGYEYIGAYDNPFHAWSELQSIRKEYMTSVDFDAHQVIIGLAAEIQKLKDLAACEHKKTEILDNNQQPEPSQATWDCTFLMNCLSSSTALKSYGVVLIIAACITVTALSMGIVPVAIGSAVALSASLTAAACFFYAKPDAGTGAAATSEIGCKHSA